MLEHDLKAQPVTKPVRLHNVICPYCGVALTESNTTKEHVIGRKFVPKGTLENNWNLILNACRTCNNRKADLEDDIGAITMQPDLSGQQFGTHPQLALDAKHKGGRTISRYTRKAVAESRPTLNIKYDLGPGMKLSFNMIGQAQIDDERVFELAGRHFQAFFYFITYNHTENRGWWWKGMFAQILGVSKPDWGNDLALAFMRQTQDWDHRVLAITAEEHFKLVIRKHLTQDVWSLAVEWNESYRVFAACGDEVPLRAFVEALPSLQLQTISQSHNAGLAVRTEKKLKDEDDVLFAQASSDSPMAAP
jgi:hypothetical protein